MKLGAQATRPLGCAFQRGMGRTLTPLLVLAACVACLRTPASDPPTKNGQPDVLAEFNIAKGGRLITVPLELQEREYLFVLDTGMAYTALDTSLTKLLGQPIGVKEARTLAGSARSLFFNPPEAFLGALDLRQGGPVTSADLESIRRATGRDIRGVIGMEFLKHYVIRIDFDSGKLQFRRWDGRSHPEWGTTVHLLQPAQADIVPYANARLPGAGNILFCVDSGSAASASMVTEVFAKATDQASTAESFTSTPLGVRRHRSGRLSSLTLGGFDHRELVVDEQNSNLIGLDLLSRYVVAFDFPGMKMYLQKGQSFDKPDEFDMSGLHLWSIEDKIIVHSVDDGSPASTAGIKPEDVVLRVGDQSSTPMVLDDLRDILRSGDGKEIRMTIKRGEVQKAITFKLKKRI
jgi:hypothetical protein